MDSSIGLNWNFTVFVYLRKHMRGILNYWRCPQNCSLILSNWYYFKMVSPTYTPIDVYEQANPVNCKLFFQESIRIIFSTQNIQRKRSVCNSVLKKLSYSTIILVSFLFFCLAKSHQPILRRRSTCDRWAPLLLFWFR